MKNEDKMYKMNTSYIPILSKLTDKYNLDKRLALEELLQLEDHIRINQITKNNNNFSNSYFYLALGCMSKRYKNE